MPEFGKFENRFGRQECQKVTFGLATFWGAIVLANDNRLHSTIAISGKDKQSPAGGKMTTEPC